MTEIYLELTFLSERLKGLIERAKETDKEQTYQLQQFTHKLLTDSNSDRSIGFEYFSFNNFPNFDHKLPHQKTSEAFRIIYEMKAGDLFHIIKLCRLYGPDYAMRYILQKNVQSNVGKRITETKTPLRYRSRS